MQTVTVHEIFESIQGESTWAGLTCFFIRLAGCNLRCAYCDTPEAWTGGTVESVASIVRRAAKSKAAIVEITGGEPLLQPGAPELARRLAARLKRPVLIETNGTLDISLAPEGVVTIMDVKTPGSGEHAAFDPANLARLRPRDEVKFVLTGREDYEWARRFVRRTGIVKRCAAVLFSPARGRLAAADLGQWILRDGLPVRLQLQLHRVLRMR
jgi:7-carboxy-7-deazaguanine synthase